MTNITKTDMDAINRDNAAYILNKGAGYYRNGDYDNAVEYYHLAAAMGEGKISAQAAANLGYCYLYGRHTEQNISLALAYFQIAAYNWNIDALYKLGNIYSSNKFVQQDIECSNYYYALAIQAINNDYEVSATDYPSAFLAIGKEYMPGGQLTTDIKLAYKYLRIAAEGYEIAIANGNEFYLEAYEKTKSLLNDNVFNIFNDDEME